MNNFTPVSAAGGGALIGLSAVLLMLFTGRIAGVSRILDELTTPHTNARACAATFFPAIIAPLFPAVLVGSPAPRPQRRGNYLKFVVGGLLLVFGARLVGGGPWAQGIGGIALLPP